MPADRLVTGLGDRGSLLAAVFDESPIATLRTAVLHGRLGPILEANRAAEQLLGGTGLAGRHVADLIVAGSLPDVGPALTAHPVAVRDADGDGLRWLAASVTALSPTASPADRPAALVLLLDVTERRAEDLRLDRAARHDPLTGLVNREELQRGLAALDPRRDGPWVAVVFLDLDRFKAVNDSRGHQAGDEVLVAVSRRIRAAVRPQDTLARLGGDEFVVVCPRLAAAGDARAIAERVRATLDEPVSIEGRALRITMSVGVATAAVHEVDPAGIVRAADTAMYRAKQDGRNTVRIHSPRMDAEVAAVERISRDLVAALERPGTGGAELVAHFQPVVEIATGRLCYVEALARLCAAEGTLAAPASFLSVAAGAGQAGALTERVLRLALRQHRRWVAAGITVPVGVNLAAGQLFSAPFLTQLLHVLDQEGAEPCSVVLEVGDFSAVEVTAPAELILRRVSASGLGLAIDHFGTGHASLAALRLLGPHRVKLDTSLLVGIRTSGPDQAVVRSAIQAAHALGQRVVAQGIESAQDLAVLRQLGADEAQGRLVGEPRPADQLGLPGLRWEPGTLRGLLTSP